MLAAAKLLSRRAFLMATAVVGLAAVHRAAMPALRRDVGQWRARQDSNLRPQTWKAPALFWARGDEPGQTCLGSA